MTGADTTTGPGAGMGDLQGPREAVARVVEPVHHRDPQEGRQGSARGAPRVGRTPLPCPRVAAGLVTAAEDTVSDPQYSMVGVDGRN